MKQPNADFLPLGLDFPEQHMERKTVKQPKALWLADQPYATRAGQWNLQADEELRSQHALISELRQALQNAVAIMDECCGNFEHTCIKQGRAALTKAEAQQ